MYGSNHITKHPFEYGDSRDGRQNTEQANSRAIDTLKIKILFPVGGYMRKSQACDIQAAGSNTQNNRKMWVRKRTNSTLKGSLNNYCWYSPEQTPQVVFLCESIYSFYSFYST